jgi:hypothetical protein
MLFVFFHQGLGPNFITKATKLQSSNTRERKTAARVFSSA